LFGEALNDYALVRSAGR